MKKQSGYNVIELFVVLLFVFGIGAWVWNAVKLASCDFELNYKCEAIHGAGLLVAPLSMVTVWFGDDES